MMARLGLHLPDRDYLEDAELALTRRLQPSVLLAMAYEDDKGGAEQTNELVRDLGHGDLLVRCYAPNVPQLGSWSWAEECARRLARYQAPQLHVLPGNEMNLADEGGHDDYYALAQWLIAFAQCYRSWRSSDVLHLPAPWSGWEGEEEARALEYYRVMRDEGVLDLYDAHDVHAYAGGWGLWRRVQDLIGRRVWVTEFNRVPLADVDRDLAAVDGPLGAVYFSLRWVSYEPGQLWRPDDSFSLFRYGQIVDEWTAIADTRPSSDDSAALESTPEPPRSSESGSGSATGLVEGAGDPVASPADVLSMAVELADGAKVSKRAFLGLIWAESELDPTAERWGRHTHEAQAAIVAGDHELLASIIERVQRETPNDISFGLAQQTVRWAPVGDRTHSVDNCLAVREWFFDVDNALRCAVGQLAYALRPGEPDGDLRALCRYNWPRGDGLASSSDVEDRYRRGLAWADQVLKPGDVAGAELDFDPDTFMPRQETSWSCSAAAAAWGLRALGFGVTENDLVNELGPGRISPTLGLLDRSGKGLAEVLGRYVSDVRVTGIVSWDRLVGLVGNCPVLIGGHRWGEGGHWAGVRRAGSDESGEWLEIANSSLGYAGVYDRLSRAEFEQFGPFDAVIVGGELVGVVSELRSKVNDMVTGLCHLVDVEMRPLEGRSLSRQRRLEILNFARDLRRELVGLPPEPVA